MMNKPSFALLAVVGSLSSPPAWAADDLAALRAEIAQLKQTYESRIAALEARLQQAERNANAPAATTTPSLDRSAQVGNPTAFNPQISLILDGVYFRDNRRGASPALYESIDGINHSHAHEDHAHGAIEPGFNLRATELAFSATVSPYFDASALLTISEHGDIALEEAYFDTRSLPAGLKIRGGKFLSGIGYLNDKHPHQWDFVDQNLAYRTLLGEHGLSDTGLRFTWLPKTGHWYTQLGLELLQGKEQTFATSGLSVPDVRADGQALAATSAGKLSAPKAGPRLTTLYAKLSPDLGDKHTLQIGLWGAYANQHQEVHDHSLENPMSRVHALEGKGKVWGSDWVYKYDTGRYGGAGSVKLVAEYLRQVKDLKIAFHESGALVGAPRKFTQDGFVIQANYGIAPFWQAGLRYDATGLTNKIEGSSGLLREKGKSDRWTLALTRYLTEYSLMRLQLSRANLWSGGVKEGVNQVFLQYQHSLGAHGAHSF